MSFESLASALEMLQANNPSLTHLHIEVGVGDEGARSIADSLKTNSTLTSLDISHCCIHKGIRSIADALKTNSTLEHLNISKNLIEDEGARSIAKALKTNSTLTSLDLSRGSIGNKGARSIADALKTNSTLACLDIANNDISDEGARSFGKALMTNITLIDFRFSNNIDPDLIGIFCSLNNINPDLEHHLDCLAHGCRACGKLDPTRSRRNGRCFDCFWSRARLVRIGAREEGSPFSRLPRELLSLVVKYVEWGAADIFPSSLAGKRSRELE